MTKQITVKLNYELFRPLMDELMNFAGKGIITSDSDLIAKVLFIGHYIMFNQKRNGKTVFDIVSEQMQFDKSETLVYFLNSFYSFKRKL